MDSRQLMRMLGVAGDPMPAALAADSSVARTSVERPGSHAGRRAWRIRD